MALRTTAVAVAITATIAVAADTNKLIPGDDHDLMPDQTNGVVTRFHKKNKNTAPMLETDHDKDHHKHHHHHHRHSHSHSHSHHNHNVNEKEGQRVKPIFAKEHNDGNDLHPERGKHHRGRNHLLHHFDDRFFVNNEKHSKDWPRHAQPDLQPSNQKDTAGRPRPGQPRTLPYRLKNTDPQPRHHGSPHDAPTDEKPLYHNNAHHSNCHNERHNKGLFWRIASFFGFA